LLHYFHNSLPHIFSISQLSLALTYWPFFLMIVSFHFHASLFSLPRLLQLPRFHFRCRLAITAAFNSHYADGLRQLSRFQMPPHTSILASQHLHSRQAAFSHWLLPAISPWPDFAILVAELSRYFFDAIFTPLRIRCCYWLLLAAVFISFSLAAYSARSHYFHFIFVLLRFSG